MKALALLALLLPRSAAAIAVSADPETVADARRILAELVALDTTNPPGNELLVVRRLEPLLKEAGLETRVFESAPGRGNLWARLKGAGRKKPLLITAHTDVVGAPKEGWATDPFRVTEKDGYLYGRGVLDDKGMGAAAAAVARRLARDGTRLERDLVLLFGADEEAGSEAGIGWMLKEHPELLDAEVVLNEGGGIGIEGEAITQAAVQLYEKLYLDVTLTATGDSGHSSMPSRANAVTRLARAVARAGEHRFPARLNAVTRAYFDGLARSPVHPLREAFAALVSTDAAASGRAEAALSAIPFYDAQLRTTCAPTVMNAGFRANAIPGRAQATLNCRVLPDQTREEILGALRRAIDDPVIGLEAEALEEPRMSPFADPFFDAARAVLAELAPDAVAVPFMSAGATDSRRLRARGLKAYGLVPFPITAEDKSRMHGDNERVRVSSVEFGVEFLRRLILRSQ